MPEYRPGTYFKGDCHVLAFLILGLINVMAGNTFFGIILILAAFLLFDDRDQ